MQSALQLPFGPFDRTAAPTEPAVRRTDLPARPLSAGGLLTGGGDARIQLDEANGLNRYGCQPYPDDGLSAFGSSTASVISVNAYAGAERLTERLSAALAGGADPAELYAAELDRVRAELSGCLGLDDLAGLKTLIGQSGTDLHRIVAQMIGLGVSEPPLVVGCETAETGSGVAEALGADSSAGLSLRSHISVFRPPGGARPCQLVAAPTRAADGQLRLPEAVDADVRAVVSAAAGLGRRVLLILMDVSKTGLIAPSLECALDLKQRFPDRVEVLVDACQLRIAPQTVKAYLAKDCLVALTGSKFMTGPTFSAALLIPQDAAARLSAERLPMSLAPHTAQADWPAGWNGAQALPARANFGLISRWQAALDEMQPFLALPDAQVRAFFEAFAMAVTGRMDHDPVLERLAQRPLDRAPLGLADGWDAVHTIHPFVLKGPNGRLEPKETHALYRMMAMDLGGWARAVGESPARQAAAARRVQLGQPVGCGSRNGRALSALRLSVSARQTVDALAPGGRGPQAVIDDALTALDKAAWLSGRMAEAASSGL